MQSCLTAKLNRSTSSIKFPGSNTIQPRENRSTSSLDRSLLHCSQSEDTFFKDCLNNHHHKFCKCTNTSVYLSRSIIEMNRKNSRTELDPPPAQSKNVKSTSSNTIQSTRSPKLWSMIHKPSESGCRVIRGPKTVGGLKLAKHLPSQAGQI